MSMSECLNIVESIQGDATISQYFLQESNVRLTLWQIRLFIRMSVCMPKAQDVQKRR